MTRPESKQTGESALAFEAFVIYRDMGASRTTKAVAAQLEKSHGLIARWGTAHAWVRRAHAYDAELDRRKRIVDLRDVEKMRKRQLALAQTMQELGTIELGKMLAEAVRRKKKRGSLDERTILKLIDQGAKLERLNRGEPGEIIENQGGESADLTSLSLEELKALRAMRSKLRAQQLADPKGGSDD